MRLYINLFSAFNSPHSQTYVPNLVHIFTMILHSLIPAFLLADLISSTAIKPHPKGSWAAIAPIAIEPRQEHRAVALDNDTIYILGGIYPFANLIVPTVTTVQKYSISTDTWTRVADLPLPLNHANAAVVNRKIYVLGGLTTDINNSTLWNRTGASFKYDPVPDVWRSIGALPKGRWAGSAAVGVKGSTIYMAGGILRLILSAADEEDTVSFFTSYDVVTKQFSALPDMPDPRDHAGVGLIDDKLYVIGGRAYGHNNTKDSAYAFDIKNNCWVTGLAPMPIPRGGGASGVIGNRIFVIGGQEDQDTDTGVFPQNQAYDTATNTWETYAPMDVPRHGTEGVAIGNRIYIPGGGLMQGGLPTNYTSYFQL
jgi:N-acetylneuraminic acid mutarotase